MALTESEQIAYLANMIFLAHADSDFSPRESAVIEEIRAALGAKKSALNTAMRAAVSAGYTLEHVGGFATQVCNLADMLYLCFADGDVSRRETDLLRPYCQKIGLTQDQLSTLLREAVARMDQAKLAIACPKCANPINGNAKFCAACGEPLGKSGAESAGVGFEIPASGYAVEFCESTAGGFPAALEFAKSAPAFTSSMRNKKSWYLAAWPEQDFAQVLNLAGLLGGLRNRRCYHAGMEQPWDELFGCAWCVRSRQGAYRPVEYCFGKDENRLNPWGCKQARLDWTEWAPWFSYGKFKQVAPGRHSWEFDKARIRHALETNLYRYRHCPHLDFDFIEAVLLVIPDVVHVDGLHWKYSRASEQVPGCVKIVEKDHNGILEWTHEYYADGVRPKGLRVFEDVLKKAFFEKKRQDITVDMLTAP